jgi:hypothetical protein
MAEIFYKDKSKIFECKVFVEGASIDNTHARLVLKFPTQNINQLFYGKIDENNVCTIEVPALKEIKDSKGSAILEVIADSTFFESWSGDIEIKQSKTVKVEMVSKTPANNDSPKVLVEMKQDEKKKIVEEKVQVKKNTPKEQLIPMMMNSAGSTAKAALTISTTIDQNSI